MFISCGAAGVVSISMRWRRCAQLEFIVMEQDLQYPETGFTVKSEKMLRSCDGDREQSTRGVIAYSNAIWQFRFEARSCHHIAKRRQSLAGPKSQE